MPPVMGINAQNAAMTSVIMDVARFENLLELSQAGILRYRPECG